ncbi:carbohydrate binding family 9 domain-containing protein [Fodinibius halophilus]|uniref:Carbohydrate binding family 9 domain-containing protein n=1 Tax=Fodinibius halophilus TaxID=1736908 RepID=A0A6M1T8Y7_9BACT|nr:carbohydrate binding family 9 domain-containing protein [Fodinibius halophilus]NGP89905.1 carbohydrate binding family 9 domain-containing protein [Fodinibius halophilus]
MSTGSYGQTTDPITLPRLQGSIELDGMPDETAWQKIDPLPMTMYLPESGQQPTEKSDIKVGYTDDYLYIGARLYDSEPSKIQTTGLSRDSGSPTDDWLAILLDTFNDNENMLGFYVTPGGALTDLTVFNDAQGDFPLNPSWNTFWDAETVQNGEGWFVEMRIPFSSLRYQSTESGTVTMGLIAHRWIARKSESSIFPAISNDWGWWGQHKPSLARKVQFTNLDQQRPFYVTPYLLGGFSQQHQLNDPETAYYRDDEFTYDAGLDVKYGLTSNLTMDLTVNTDFAQVEADNQQVNLTRFSLFFPEKRKFFQERASLFNFSFGGPNRLFYSRRIGINSGEEVRILGGARLVGQLGKWDLGLINMQTARQGPDIPSENFGVLRLRRKIFNKYSFLGTMFTSRIGDNGTYNYAYGLDGNIRINDDNYLTAIIAQTFENGNANNFASPGNSRVHLEWETRRIDRLGYSLSYSRSGAAYNPGIGFEVRENYSRLGNNIYYGWFSEKDSSPFVNQRLFLNGSIFFDNTDGSTQSASIGPRWNANWKNGNSINLGPSVSYENLSESFELFGRITIPKGGYRFYNFKGSFSTSEADLVTVKLNLGGGQFFDGYRGTGNLGVNWSLSPHFKLNPYYEINRVSFPDRDDHFTAHIGRIRLQYFFNTELSVSTFAQFSNAADAFISNFRLRYNPQEGNDLYIVYNENLNTNRFGYTPVKPLNNNRTILIKYTYTFGY